MQNTYENHTGHQASHEQLPLVNTSFTSNVVEMSLDELCEANTEGRFYDPRRINYHDG